MFRFDYQKQQQGTWCGAACLSMALKYFGIDKTQENIMKEIWGNETPKLSKLSLNVCQIPMYVEGLGLHSCGVQGLNPVSFIDWCLENGIALIMSHKERNNPSAHYALLEKRDGNTLYATDPWIKNNFPMQTNLFEELWQTNWNVSNGGVAGNTGVLISSNSALFCRGICIHCKKEYSGIKIPINIATNVICPHCNDWNSLAHTP